MSFKPAFMHQFVEDDLIAGFEDLHLNFYFTPLSLDCYFTYSYKSRTRDSINLEFLFDPHFKNGLITDRAEFERKIKEQANFVIPAKPESRVARQGIFYDTYTVQDMTEPKFAKYLKNVQVFLLFFIENGRLIDHCDSSWKMVLMYEKVAKCNNRKPIIALSLGLCLLIQ